MVAVTGGVDGQPGEGCPSPGSGTTGAARVVGSVGAAAAAGVSGTEAGQAGAGVGAVGAGVGVEDGGSGEAAGSAATGVSGELENGSVGAGVAGVAFAGADQVGEGGLIPVLGSAAAIPGEGAAFRGLGLFGFIGRESFNSVAKIGVYCQCEVATIRTNK